MSYGELNLYEIYGLIALKTVERAVTTHDYETSFLCHYIGNVEKVWSFESGSLIVTWLPQQVNVTTLEKPDRDWSDSYKKKITSCFENSNGSR